LKTLKLKITVLFLISLASFNSFAAKVAVTELTYSERVQEYIHIVDYHNKSSASASSSAATVADPYGEAVTGHQEISGQSKTDYFEYEHNFSYLEFGELRKFTADIKGEMIRSKGFKLVQARPVNSNKPEKLYDIIGRIKKGLYKGADYVLFGTVSDMSFSNDTYQPENGAINTLTFSLTLVAEFSLINTRTYEVVASFSATGTGSDSKIISQGTYATPNRSLVVSSVSKSLGVDVINQLDEQLGLINPNDKGFDKTDNTLYDQPGQVRESGVTVFH
jgi:curli biogenesis system outer membrane secretion channel CsgG